MEKQVITAFGVGRVIRSKNSKFSAGAIVVSPFFPFAEYCITPPTFLRVVDPMAGIELPAYLSSLGKPCDMKLHIHLYLR